MVKNPSTLTLPPFTTNPPTATKVELVDDAEYAIRNDHYEGIWETI